jgi:hypothetical protein
MGPLDNDDTHVTMTIKYGRLMNIVPKVFSKNEIEE